MRRLATILAVVLITATSCFRIDAVKLLDLADSPDPSGVVRTDGSLVVFSTQTTGFRIRRTTFDPSRRLQSRDEALPTNAAWMSGGNLWAPDVAQLGDRWAMFFAAQTAPTSGWGVHQCVGVAFADDLMGSFVPDDDPVVCSTGPEEFIDPSVFFGPDGDTRLLYRRGAGGDRIHEILTAPLDVATGHLAGPPTLLVDLADAAPASLSVRGSRVENPQMVRGADGTFGLFVSAAEWTDASYTTLQFACSSPVSCVRRARPTGPGPYTVSLRTSGVLVGPGGMSEARVENAPAARSGIALFHGIAPGRRPIHRMLYIAVLTDVGDRR